MKSILDPKQEEVPSIPRIRPVRKIARAWPLIIVSTVNVLLVVAVIALGLLVVK